MVEMPMGHNKGKQKIEESIGDFAKFCGSFKIYSVIYLYIYIYIYKQRFFGVKILSE